MTFDHHHFETLPSTNDWALAQLKSRPLQRPLLVTTDRQTHGRGQRGNQWQAEAGSSVAMSLAMTRSSCHDPVLFNKAVALAIREVLVTGADEAVANSGSTDAAQLRPPLLLKWPNDLMILSQGEAQKLGGILIENQWRGSEWSASVIGLGVNVHSSPAILTGSGALPVSLAQAWNWQPDIADLCQRLAQAMSQADGMDDVHARYDSALLGRGELRRYQVQGQTWMGSLQGVDHQGLAQFQWQPQSGTPSPPSSMASGEVVWSWSNPPGPDRGKARM